MRKSESGFTLLEVLAGLAVMGGLSVAVLSVATFSAKVSQQTAIRNGAMAAYVALVSKIEDPKAWKSTVDVNTSMNCLKAHSDCAGAGGVFVVNDSASQKFYDGSNSSAGFAFDGEVCGAFGQTNDCAYHYDVEWKPICPASGACTDPLINVKAVFAVSQSAKSAAPIVTSNYDFTKTIGFRKNYLDTACIAMGGTFNAETKSCNMASKEMKCPAGSTIVGINLQGTATCAPISRGSCPAGQGIAGFKEDGSLICSERVVAAVTATETSSKGSCPQAKRGNGEIWEVPNGSHRTTLACANNPATFQYQVNDDWLEVQCQDSVILPTGRAHSNPRSVEGVCSELKTGNQAHPVDGGDDTGNKDAIKCPSGTADGQTFLGVATNYVDSGACPADLSKNFTRSYQTSMEYRCTSGSGIATGVIKKDLIAETSCPGSCKDDEIATKDGVTGAITCSPATCKVYVEIQSFPADIPARTSTGVCYYKKLFSAIPFSTSIDPPNRNVLARNHGGGPQNSYALTMGAASPQFRLLGQRAVKLSGGISASAAIQVDNFVLSGRRAGEEPIQLNDWAVNGTADSALINYRNGNYIQAYSQDVPVTSFGPGGTATLQALTLKQFSIYRSFIADINAMDCGGSRQLSNVYLIFQ